MEQEGKTQSPKRRCKAPLSISGAAEDSLLTLHTVAKSEKSELGLQYEDRDSQARKLTHFLMLLSEVDCSFLQLMKRSKVSYEVLCSVQGQNLPGEGALDQGFWINGRIFTYTHL